MLTVLNGLFNSKIIYGLQLLGKVRLSDQDPQNAELESIQLMQNKLVRFLKGKTIADRICTESLLSKANILSVNQQNAKLKLQEIWKSLNIENYPLKIQKQEQKPNVPSTRACTEGRLIELRRKTLTFKTCISDAIRIWNQAPHELKNSITFSSSKKGY